MHDFEEKAVNSLKLRKKLKFSSLIEMQLGWDKKNMLMLRLKMKEYVHLTFKYIDWHCIFVNEDDSFLGSTLTCVHSSITTQSKCVNFDKNPAFVENESFSEGVAVDEPIYPTKKNLITKFGNEKHRSKLAYQRIPHIFNFVLTIATLQSII
uniref:Uncharacterized protein n=1 Tax=Romanomermis culicivorax TaxID=13658 RepID=A0A915IK86_ROMCU